MQDGSIDLVQAIDVSNYQSRNLAQYAYLGCTHATVRLSLESNAMRAHAQDQIKSALDLGWTCDGYLWLYAGHAQESEVAQAVDLYANAAGRYPKVLWLDVEPYTDGSLPSITDIQRALNGCKAQHVTGGIYTGPWVWPKLGNPTTFKDVWLWNANYNNKADLTSVSSYGGMIQVGHQYTSTPIDRSVFLSSAVA